jgi:hypothetical protein
MPDNETNLFRISLFTSFPVTRPSIYLCSQILLHKCFGDSSNLHTYRYGSLIRQHKINFNTAAGVRPEQPAQRARRAIPNSSNSDYHKTATMKNRAWSQPTRYNYRSRSSHVRSGSPFSFQGKPAILTAPQRRPKNLLKSAIPVVGFLTRAGKTN